MWLLKGIQKLRNRKRLVIWMKGGSDVVVEEYLLGY